MQRLISTAVQLWRDAPNWRRGVLLASALTVAAALPLGGSSAPAPVGGGTQGSSFTPPGGSTGGSTIVQPVPPTAQSLGCLFKAVNTPAMQQAPAGLRCEEMVRAALRCGVGPDDAVRATAAQKDALDEVRDCAPRIEASDARWAVLAEAMGAYRQRPTLGRATRVGAAAEALGEFDRERASAKDKERLLADAEVARAARQIALDRIAALGSLSRLYRGADPQSLSTVTDLAAGYRAMAGLALEVSDADLIEADRNALAAAADAQSVIDESDRRLDAIATAGARRDREPLPYVRSVASLTDFDRARVASGAVSGVSLDEIQAGVRSSLASAIDLIVKEYADRATLGTARQLVRLREMAQAEQVELGAAAREGLAQVDRDLAGHGTRMDLLRRAAAAWSELRTAGITDPAQRKPIEDQVNRVMAALAVPGTLSLNPYDAEGLDAETRKAFGVLAQAFVAISGRLGQGSASSVSAHVDCTRISDKLVQPVCERLREELGRAGFRIVDTPRDSVIAIRLSDPALRDAGRSRSTGLPQRELELSARLEWSYSGRSVDLGRVAALGSSRDLQAAIEEVHRRSARAVYEKAAAALGG